MVGGGAGEPLRPRELPAPVRYQLEMCPDAQTWVASSAALAVFLAVAATSGALSATTWVALVAASFVRSESCELPGDIATADPKIPGLRCELVPG